MHWRFISGAANKKKKTNDRDSRDFCDAVTRKKNTLLGIPPPQQITVDTDGTSSAPTPRRRQKMSGDMPREAKRAMSRA